MTQDVIIASNGAHIDPVTRRFVAGGKPVTAIDSPSMGRELVQRRIEKKRQAIIDAANRLAAEGGALSGTQYSGDLAFVGHVAEAQFVKATNPDDPKSTDAARFLLTEAGLAEAKQAEQVSNTLNVVALPADVLALLREADAFDSYTYRNHEQAIEGTVTQAGAAGAGADGGGG